MYLSDNYLARSSFQEKKQGYGVISYGGTGCIMPRYYFPSRIQADGQTVITVSK